MPVPDLSNPNRQRHRVHRQVPRSERASGQHPLDLWRAARGIEHRLIPVGQKELNGKVENTHKQDDREFYAVYVPNTVEHLERAMRGWSDRWNTLRRTKALGWKTPDEALQWAYVRALAWLGCIANGRTALHKLNGYGDALARAQAATHG